VAGLFIRGFSVPPHPEAFAIIDGTETPLGQIVFEPFRSPSGAGVDQSSSLLSIMQ